MVFEDISLKLDNLLTTTSGFGSKMHKLVSFALEDKKRFDEEVAKLKKAVEEINLEGVNKEMQITIKNLEMLLSDLLKAQEIVILYAHNRHDELENELKMLKDNGKKVAFFAVDSVRHNLLLTDGAQFMPKLRENVKKSTGFDIGHDIRDFTENLKKEQREIGLEIEKIVSKFTEILKLFQELSRDERWEKHRFRTINFSLNIGYQAQQSASAVKHKGKELPKEINRFIKEFKGTISSSKALKSEKDLIQFLKGVMHLKTELKKQDSIATNVCAYLTNVFKFCVTFYFHTMDDDKVINQIGSRLKSEGFPAEDLSKHAKRLHEMQVRISELIREERAIANKFFQRAA